MILANPITRTTTVYAATSITKEVAVSDYESGDERERTCTMSQPINVQSPFLSALIGDLGRKYALDIKEVFVDSDENISSFEYDRYEDDDGNDVGTDPGADDAWRTGELKVWHAVYTFTVEKRQLLRLDAPEFADAGITLI